MAQWHGDAPYQHVRGPSCQVRKIRRKEEKPKTLLLQDCPGHLDGSTPRGSSPAHESFIQAGHLTQTVTKLQFDAKKLEKADRSATACRCPRCMIWTLETFLSHPPVKGNASISEVCQRGISPKNGFNQPSRAHTNSALASFSESEYFGCMCVLNSG